MSDTIGKLASIAFVGFLIGGVLKYAIELVIARGMGPAALGVFSFGLMIVHVGGTFARGGFEQAAQKYVPIYRGDDEPGRVVGLLLTCLVGSLALGAVAVAVGLPLVDRADATVVTSNRPAIRLFVLGVPLFALMTVAAYATRGFKETKYSVAVQSVVQPIVAIALVSVAVTRLGSVRGVALGYLVSLAAGSVLAIYFVARLVDAGGAVRPEFDVGRIVTYALPLLVVAASYRLVTWTDVLMLGVFESATTIGIYQAAFRTTEVLAMVLGAADAIFPSVASDLYHDDRHERLQLVYEVTTKWVVYFTALGFLFLAVFSRAILGLFGEQFVAAVPILLVIGLSRVVTAMAGPSGYLLTMSEFDRLEVANSLAVALANVGLNYLLIPRFGAMGAAIATGLSLGLLNVARIVEVRVLFGFGSRERRYWKGVVGICGAVVVMLVGRELPSVGPTVLTVFGVGVVSLAVFAGIVYLLGPEEADRTLLQSVQ